MLIDPASKPIEGCWPSANAKPTPTAFCSTSRPTTDTMSISSSRPPRTSRARSAPRPTVAKNISIKGCCREGSRRISTPMPRMSVISTAATRASVTGSGML
jgi:hypothetical protein